MTGRQQEPTAPEVAVASAIGAALHAWFGRMGRNFPWRHWEDEYRIAVAEVLLQRTRATTVASFIDGFLEQYPSAHALATADLAELEAALEPVGIQRRRAVALRALAESLIGQPELDWQHRPGVGQYISRAIAVSVDDAALAMVDTNFVRIVRRAFRGTWMADYRYDRRLQSLAAAVVAGADSPRVVNWAVLDLGALICRPTNPVCQSCPIRQWCNTGRNGQKRLRSAATAI